MNGIEDSVLVLVVDQLIAEHTFALMSPKTNGVKFWLEIFDSVCLHD
jgi:hypothetical protein